MSDHSLFFLFWNKILQNSLEKGMEAIGYLTDYVKNVIIHQLNKNRTPLLIEKQSGKARGNPLLF